MKHFTFFLLMFVTGIARAQQIDSIYVNLYTDSLKKGTFNYINIDGLLAGGRYLPLDSTDIIFSASAGIFSGNSLWIAPDFKEEKVTIKVIVRNRPSLYKEFDIYIKKNPDNEKLKTIDEISNEIKKNNTPLKKDS